MCDILGVRNCEMFVTQFSNVFSLKFEADRRAFMITINAIGTALTQDERMKLYPTCGLLNPDGLQELRRADSVDAVREVANRYSVKHRSKIFVFLLIEFSSAFSNTN